MAKLISSIQHSFTGKNGEVVKGIILGDKQSKFPFDLYAQKCLRLSLFLGRYGDKAAAVLQHFIDGKQVPQSDTLGYTEYKGHELIQLKASADDKMPLQFGAGKAKLVVECLKAHSLMDVQATLQDVIGDAKAADRKAPSKGKGKGKPQGGKGGGKPKVEVEIEDLDLEDVEISAHEAKAAAQDPEASELSVSQEIARLEGLVAEMFKQLPLVQAKIRGLKATLVTA